MLESEILTQGDVHDLDCHRDELPALDTDVGLVTARSDVVIIRQIDIEAEFLREWAEGGEVSELLPVARVGAVDGTDLETRGEEAEDILSDAMNRCQLDLELWL